MRCRLFNMNIESFDRQLTKLNNYDSCTIIYFSSNSISCKQEHKGILVHIGPLYNDIVKSSNI